MVTRLQTRSTTDISGAWGAQGRQRDEKSYSVRFQVLAGRDTGVLAKVRLIKESLSGARVLLCYNQFL